MITLNIKVLPRSSKNEIVGKMEDGTLKIKLTAPPVDGEANKKLVELLSKEYDVPKSKIKIVRGMGSRNKIIEIPSES
ncbi:MAG: YggU family protein [Candidatus Magasanikbacteria bacterium]|nr:YggU family protein [Candidatus Magasanikbacteria bacterium]